MRFRNGMKVINLYAVEHIFLFISLEHRCNIVHGETLFCDIEPVSEMWYNQPDGFVLLPCWVRS